MVELSINNPKFENGATTLSITTFSIMTLSREGINVTLSISDTKQ